MPEPNPIDVRSAPPAWKVLVVDDDTVLLEAVRRGFEQAGADVTACEGFEEGRRALRSRQFDALITDVRLGAFNGLQLAVIARTHRPDIRVVVFSGYDDPVLRSEAEHAGARYVTKPVQVAELMNLLGIRSELNRDR
jgi:DNA-binding response OmpR family regulator